MSETLYIIKYFYKSIDYSNDSSNRCPQTPNSDFAFEVNINVSDINKKFIYNKIVISYQSLSH